MKVEVRRRVQEEGEGEKYPRTDMTALDFVRMTKTRPLSAMRVPSLPPFGRGPGRGRSGDAA